VLGYYVGYQGFCVSNCVIFASDGITCVTCAARTFLSAGVCLMVSSVCQTWNSTNGVCTSCYSGWVLVYGGICVQGALPDVCLVANASGFCQVCDAGYYAGPQGFCISNCLTFAQGGNGVSCITCAPRTYLSGGLCLMVSSVC